MNKNTHKQARRNKRRIGIRKRISGTGERPRLSIYKSLNHIYAQIINDLDGRTLAAASSNDKGVTLDKTGNSTRRPSSAMRSPRRQRPPASARSSSTAADSSITDASRPWATRPAREGWSSN